MPWIPFVEKWYDHRYVENTITDRSFEGGRRGGTVTAGGAGAIGNSSDWGIHALGATMGDNSTNYPFSVVNGRGYRNLSRFKSVDEEARFGCSPIEQMVIAVGGCSGKRGNDVEAGAPTRTATRGDAMIAWRDKTWGAGVEYFHSENWDDILKYQGTGPGVGAASGTLKDKADGCSVWADFKFADTWAIFARDDKLDCRYTNLLGVEQKIKDMYYNAGISCRRTSSWPWRTSTTVSTVRSPPRTATRPTKWASGVGRPSDRPRKRSQGWYQAAGASPPPFVFSEFSHCADGRPDVRI